MADSCHSTATCTRKASPSARDLYADAWSKVKRGNLAGASADVDSFGASDSAADVEWASRFRVLKAEILRRQGKFDDCLALLEAPLPEQFAKSDIAVWRKITQGTAEAFLGQYDLAEKSLTEAEALAKQNQPDLLGEVALKKGTLAWLRGDSDAARSGYLASLSVARTLHDSYLEANSLTNLGNVATKQEHFDESIDWNRAALQVMQSTDAPGARANILGNMGWSYLGFRRLRKRSRAFPTGRRCFRKGRFARSANTMATQYRQHSSCSPGLWFSRTRISECTRGREESSR